MRLLDRKMANAARTGAPVIASANPGCNIQLEYGKVRADLRVVIKHPVTLLAEAYRAESAH